MTFKRLMFVSGKGGVGKSTLSLLLAKSLAREGKRVLHVELSGQSAAQALLQQEKGPGLEPSTSGFGFDWCRLEAIHCLVEYVSSITRVRGLTRTLFKSAMVSSLLDVAPGLNDLAILGKLTSQVRGHGPGFDYDHVIVDAPSTGSFASLLAAPELLGASVSSGPMFTQSQGIMKVLRDPRETHFFFVSLYEELPVDELEETLVDFLPRFPNQASIIVNKVLPSDPLPDSARGWKDFFQPRLNEQIRQRQRLAPQPAPLFEVNLLTKPLKKELASMNQELLRHTSAS